MQLWNVCCFNQSLFRFKHFILFKVFEVSVWRGCLMTWELLLELICVLIEFLDHFIDVFDMIF